jgi:hypothetical protein
MSTFIAAKKRATIKNKGISFGISYPEKLSPREIVDKARTGVHVALFYNFAKDIGWNEKDVAQLLNTSPKTFQNYRALAKPLEPITAEHLLKLIDLFKKGERTFAGKENFNQWLQTDFWNGTGQPMKWLNTPGGVDIINEELDNILVGNPL